MKSYLKETSSAKSTAYFHPGANGISLPAVPVLQNTVVQKVDNTGGNMGSVDQNGEVFVQSNDTNSFRYALPAAMTYHHIIPRNKLADFWNAVQGKGHLMHLSPAIDSLLSKAIDRVKQSPGLQNSTLLEINGTEQTKDQLMAIMDKMGEGKALTNAENDGANIIEKIYQWWPANIHHGPNDRPKYQVPEEDDGDDKFEISAKHVVPGAQFALLEKLDGLMDSYTKNPDLKVVKNIKGILIQLQSVTSITAFDASKWYQISKGALKGKWRIKST